MMMQLGDPRRALAGRDDARQDADDRHVGDHRRGCGVQRGSGVRVSDVGALLDRRQRAREAFEDMMGAPSPMSGGSLLMRAAERQRRAREAAIETATRVRVDDDIIEAAQNAFPVLRDVAEGKVMLTAAFRAAGFEVEE